MSKPKAVVKAVENTAPETAPDHYIHTAHTPLFKAAAAIGRTWSKAYLNDAVEAGRANKAFTSNPSLWVRKVKEAYGECLATPANAEVKSADATCAERLSTKALNDYRRLAMNAVIWAMVANPTDAAVKKHTLKTASEAGLVLLETSGVNDAFVTGHICIGQRAKTLSDKNINPESGEKMTAQEKMDYLKKVAARRAKSDAKKAQDKADKAALVAESFQKPENLHPHIADTLEKLKTFLTRIDVAIDPANAKTPAGSAVSMVKLLTDIKSVIVENTI